MRIISFDIALKSIAICIVVIEDKKIKIIKTITEDLCPYRVASRVDITEKCYLTRCFLEQNIIPDLLKDDIILIEKQIHTTQTAVIYHAVITMLCNYKIELIQPSLKNSLTIGDYEIKDFYKKYSTSYKANKEHCRAMFKHFIKDVDGKENIIYDKKMETDLADSLMQILVFIK